MRLLLFLLITGCTAASSIPKQTQAVELLEATSQRLEATSVDSSKNINHNFKVLIKTDKPIRFDSIWVNNRGYEAKVIKGTILNQQDSITNNDTVTLKISDFKLAKDPVEEVSYDIPAEPQPKEESPPIKHDGDALIRYFVEDKEEYVVVDSVETVAEINPE